MLGGTSVCVSTFIMSGRNQFSDGDTANSIA